MYIKDFNNYISENFSSINEEYNNLFISLLYIRDQAHIFHWQTESASEHKAFGDFYTFYLEKLDLLAEVIIGIKGRPIFDNIASINLTNYSDSAVKEYCDNTYRILTEDTKSICNDKYEHISEIINSIFVEFDKLNYLLTLK